MRCASVHKAYCIIPVLLLSVILAGCQKRVTVAPSRQWTCDEKADMAIKKGDYQSGMRLHRRILEKDPHHALASYHLGYAYGQLGQHTQEVHYYEQAVSEGYDQDADLFYNLGMAYGELNMPPKAVSAFKRAVALNPESCEYHYGLAIAYRVNSNTASAEDAFLKAIEIDPNYLDARWDLGLLYVDSGHLAKARHQLRKILAIDPSHHRAKELLNRIGGK